MREISASIIVGVFLLIVPIPLDLRAEDPLYAKKGTEQKGFSWLKEIERQVPVLKHERGNRLPMILWETGPFEPQSAETYKMLLARGLTQHIQLTTNHIATAQALQAVGSPVIMMQGAGGAWPSNLAGDPKEWAHQFEGGYKPAEYARPCLAIFKGWAIGAESVRATLRQYKAAGVTVDGVWMDWEGDPMYADDAYDQASHCTRCRAMLPASVLASKESFELYRTRLLSDVLAAYLAAPVSEIFPKCETTNWALTLSTPEHPLKSWGDRLKAPTIPGMFTATNPVAYGNTIYWQSWKKEWTVDREHVDQFYFHLLIRMVSGDQATVARWAPHLKCFPWVDRWCPDDEDPKIPIMTRERYREVLRHLWLRGVDGMQVFQPLRPGFEEICVSEVQDAVEVYDEMLVYREFLDAGEPITFDVPQPQDEGVVWSGLRLSERAVVRLFKQGGGREKISVEPWPGKKIKLEATSNGKTYLLKLEGDKITAQD